MTTVLDSLEDVLEYAGVRHTRLDGSTKASERGHILHSFTTETSIEVLLLSVRSGGVCPPLHTVPVFNSTRRANRVLVYSCQMRCLPGEICERMRRGSY